MAYEPLDLTPAAVKASNPFALPSREATKWRTQQRDERIARQREARINRGIDWTACLVPGCAEVPHFRDTVPDRLRDHTYALPLCIHHLLTARAQSDMASDQEREFNIAVAAEVAERRQQCEDDDYEQIKAARRANTNGDIYFIRIGDLIKVGWTRDMWSRLKSYGASAELLVCYPGTRDDETNLHRQLTPARAKGREWYEDGAIIADFLEDALRLYGPPQPFDGLWTEPKATVRLRRRR